MTVELISEKLRFKCRATSIIRKVTTIEGGPSVIQTDIINVRQMRFASSRFISRRDNNGINTRERDNAEPRTKRFITNRESCGIPRDKGKCGEPGTPYIQ